ncbi:MAG: hypothetical protein GDA38_27015 [Hormoscilla sp. SP12CHS1]|nr:hypothetical protein [Hormoscilla sp. SP12CHS1]
MLEVTDFVQGTDVLGIRGFTLEEVRSLRVGADTLVQLDGVDIAILRNTVARTLDGGDGNDTLIGEEGADVFILRQSRGQNTIWDFVDGTDHILLIGDGGYLSYDDVTIDSLDGNTVIEATGIYAILQGVDRSLINAEDFTNNPYVVTEISDDFALVGEEFNLNVSNNFGDINININRYNASGLPEG